MRAIIESTCDKISPNLYTYSNVGSKPSGTWNDEVGYGRINVERALLAACAVGHDEDDDCSGCGGACIEERDPECSAPSPVPWLPFDRCQYFYEARSFDLGRLQDRLRLELRITYQHCLRLLGRQQGPLLYTTTLLPGEEIRIFEFDRYRRMRAATERVSVHTSYRQTLSALSQTRRSASSTAYVDVLNDIRTHADLSVSAGGGLAGFLGAPSVSGGTEVDTQTTVASGASLRTASEQFTQLAITASQAIEAERSLVVSTFEEQEHQNTTARTLKNTNPCFAVTYYVRRVNEAYEASTRIESVEWRQEPGPWRSFRDTTGVSETIRKLLDQLRTLLPREGDMVRDPRPITLPTDGTLYEPELAHCSSCEPTREAEEKIRLEHLRVATRRACLEVELLALEVERRRALLQSAHAAELMLPQWPIATTLLPAGATAPMHAPAAFVAPPSLATTPALSPAPAMARSGNGTGMSAEEHHA